MRRVVGLTREQLELRERVFANLVAKALRQTVKTLTLQPLTATGFNESQPHNDDNGQWVKSDDGILHKQLGPDTALRQTIKMLMSQLLVATGFDKNQLRDANGRWTRDSGELLETGVGSVTRKSLAIHYYSGAGFRRLNETLDAAGDLSTVPNREVYVQTSSGKFTFVEVSPRDVVKNLDQAILESPVKKSMILYRGTKAALPNVDDVIERGGYVSTSISEDKARHYYTDAGDSLWQIEVPAGAFALPITEGPNIHEEEWVLPRNSKFKVISVKRKKDYNVVRAVLITEPLTAAVGDAETTDVTLSPLELAVVTTTWQTYVNTELYPFLVDTYLAAGAATANAVQTALGITLPQPTLSAAEAYLADAPNRLRGVGDQLWEQLRAQLAEGYAAGESTHQLAARIRETATLTEPRALTIARTEVIPAANAASLEQVQLAFSDDECSKEWLATNDARTREAHLKADGQRVPVHQNFTVGGEALPYPGWPGGSAENVIQCRCTVAFVFADDAGEDNGDSDYFSADAESLTAAAAVTRRERIWTLTDERKHKRDARGRFARKTDAVGVGGKLKLKDALAADTGGDDTELDPELTSDIHDTFTGKFADLHTGNVVVRPGRSAGSVKIEGSIFDAVGTDVGQFTRVIRTLKSGDIEAEHVTLLLNKDVQGQGFSHAFNRHVFAWYRENDVKQVTLLANIDVGGYAWARAGYDWKNDDVDSLLDLQGRVNVARQSGTSLLSKIPVERREEQRKLAQQLYLEIADTVTDDTDPDELPDIIEMWPTPFELSQLGRWPGAGKDDWWIGKSIMMGSNWWGVLYLGDVNA